MPRPTIVKYVALCAGWLWLALPADAQIVEAVGARALGMGGAFVAVANDSTATWWNPAALADGPFFDLALGRATSERREALPASGDRTSGFSMSTPPFGVSVYRIGVAGATPAGPVAGGADGRQDEEAPAELAAWTATSVGATIVQTLMDGTHVGATVKYVRGTVRPLGAVSAAGPDGALADAWDLEGGRAEGRLDLDIGALAVAGAVRLGLLVRNVRAPEFGDGAFALPRQARVGVAVSAEQVGGPPLIVAVDADLVTYQSVGGARRVVAIGGEQWLAGRRIGLRAGARFNREGERERALTAGASLALRPGSFLEAHLVGGGSPAERGWGTGVRVSF